MSLSALHFGLRASAQQAGYTTLFSYVPGDANYTLTRGSAAKYRTSGGVLAEVSANVARDNHYPGASGDGNVRTLLLEGSRTNTFLRSETIANNFWTKNAGNISTDTHQTPDNQTIRVRYVPNTNPSQHYLARLGLGSANNQDQCASGFFKADSYAWLRIFPQTKAGTNYNSWFNLSDGSYGTVHESVTLRAVPYQDGYWRVSVTWNAGTGSVGDSIHFGVVTANEETNFAGNGTDGMRMFGLQLESGVTWPTSYYGPTTTAALTRGADAFALTDTFSNQTFTQYVRYWDLETQQIVDAVSEHTAAAPASIAAGRAYTHIYGWPGSVSLTEARTRTGV